MFTEQHTPEQVTTYEVARELLGRQVGQALEAKRAAVGPEQLKACEQAVTDAVQQRKALRVGSPEADRIVAEAKAARAASPAHA